jgi:hypothetical protein
MQSAAHALPGPEAVRTEVHADEHQALTPTITVIETTVQQHQED